MHAPPRLAHFTSVALPMRKSPMKSSSDFKQQRHPQLFRAAAAALCRSHFMPFPAATTSSRSDFKHNDFK
eukprot:620161-Amphidinium_carterae.2